MRFVFALLLLAATAAGSVHAAMPEPGPAWTPAEVVRIQLEALRANGADDAGIATCFAFASPGNRRVTGPLARFARMIRQGPYALMLRYRDAEFHPVEVGSCVALQRVTLLDATMAVTYVFVLSRQGETACAECCPGCWMTDGVYIEKVDRRVT